MHGERLDLPGELVQLEHYCATLGHKINHSFHYNCTEWFFQHPRHGLIPSVVATQHIPAGAELCLHYGYDPRNCPDWYEAKQYLLIIYTLYKHHLYDIYTQGTRPSSLTL